jgi:hypothetical protein
VSQKGDQARCWWLTPVILATHWRVDQEDHSSKPAWIIVHMILTQKYSTQKKAGGVPQAVECLPSKCEVLSSNASIAKKKKKERKKKDQMSLTICPLLMSFAFGLCFYLRPQLLMILLSRAPALLVLDMII